MNDKAKSTKLDLQKIVLISLILAVAGYQWYQNNYPADPSVEVVTDRSRTFSDEEFQVNVPADKVTDRSVTEDSNAKPLSKSLKPAAPFLKSAGGKNLKSPAGLIYGMGSGGEHRTDHVLRHSHDDTTRPTHGVFYAQGDEVFQLIDEAYALVKRNSNRVKSERSNGKMAHVINMKRKIGFKGGQSGKRANNPVLYKIKLILVGNNRVITAYPF